MDMIWMIIAGLFYTALYLIIEVWYKGNRHNKTDKKGSRENEDLGGDDKNKDRLPPSQK